MLLKAHQSNTGSLMEEVGEEIEKVGKCEKQKVQSEKLFRSFGLFAFGLNCR